MKRRSSTKLLRPFRPGIFVANAYLGLRSTPTQAKLSRAFGPAEVGNLRFYDIWFFGYGSFRTLFLQPEKALAGRDGIRHEEFVAADGDFVRAIEPVGGVQIVAAL